jgi:RNA polymerase subunit RPABC4/transcription elongation factor Spt4
MRRLRGVCAKCGRPVEPTWKICPYCETQVVDESTMLYNNVNR